MKTTKEIKQLLTELGNSQREERKHGFLTLPEETRKTALMLAKGMSLRSLKLAETGWG